jgi:hypothetical protein
MPIWEDGKVRWLSPEAIEIGDPFDAPLPVQAFAHPFEPRR